MPIADSLDLFLAKNILIGDMYFYNNNRAARFEHG
jgi:hypothetical protein